MDPSPRSWELADSPEVDELQLLGAFTSVPTVAARADLPWRYDADAADPDGHPVSFSLVTALLAGFGRAAAEVGAIIIVGGNIEGFTRTMTTAIALETSKGDLPLAVGLGVVLIAIVIAVNALAWTARRAGERMAG